MLMQIGSGHRIPMMNWNRNLGAGHLPGKQNAGTDRVKDLQMKRQQLQDEMLLMKSTSSDTGDMSAKKLEKMEEKLAEVSDKLQAAKTERLRQGEEEESALDLPKKLAEQRKKWETPDVDIYVKTGR